MVFGRPAWPTTSTACPTRTGTDRGFKFSSSVMSIRGCNFHPHCQSSLVYFRLRNVHRIPKQENGLHFWINPLFNKINWHLEKCLGKTQMQLFKSAAKKDAWVMKREEGMSTQKCQSCWSNSKIPKLTNYVLNNLISLMLFVKKILFNWIESHQSSNGITSLGI